MVSFSAAEPGKGPVPDQNRQRDGRKAPAARKSNFHVENPFSAAAPEKIRRGILAFSGLASEPA
jgi:hypothetical protein